MPFLPNIRYICKHFLMEIASAIFRMCNSTFALFNNKRTMDLCSILVHGKIKFQNMNINVPLSF